MALTALGLLAGHAGRRLQVWRASPRCVPLLWGSAPHQRFSQLVNGLKRRGHFCKYIDANEAGIMQQLQVLGASRCFFPATPGKSSRRCLVRSLLEPVGSGVERPRPCYSLVGACRDVRNEEKREKRRRGRRLVHAWRGVDCLASTDRQQQLEDTRATCCPGLLLHCNLLGLIAAARATCGVSTRNLVH